MVLCIIVLLLLGIAIAFAFLKEDKGSEMKDAERFRQEYTQVEEDNLFVYRNAEEILSILEHGTGVVYLGFPECPWCQSYVTYLDRVAKSLGVEKIYYYNISKDRSENTETYQKMVSLIGDYLPYDEEGKHRIYAPSIICLNQGEIVGFDDETAWDTKGCDTPEEYWTEEEVKDLEQRLTGMIQQTLNNVCTDCNK